MTKLKVFEIPEPVLREKAEKVEAVTPEIKQILADMLETMYATHGVGLAGNQVGLTKRLVVMDCAGQDEEPDPIKMVNPEIIQKSPDMVLHNEGCLSIPREYADVERHEWVVARYTDENGQVKERKAEGLLSICVQHELEHLEGILFIDHLSPLKRQRLVKHLEKRRRRTTAEAETEAE